MSNTVQFSASARYLAASPYSQADELRTANSLGSYGFAMETTKDTAFGVCLALCIFWITNKLEHGTDRVRGARERISALSVGIQMNWFKDAMKTQQRLADAVNRHQWDMTAALRDVGASAPSPIYEVAPDGTGLDTATVIVRTLTPHVPYVMVYRWPGAGHAIVCYRTNNKTMIFDPNCGEIACPHNEADMMWAAYWQDVANVFGSSPTTYGLAAVGIDPVADPRPAPVKNSKKCLLATAACVGRGLPDDWFELKILRAFRDEQLGMTISGQMDIVRYYAMAPGVINAIAASGDAGAILDVIYHRYVAPAAAWVADGSYEEAEALFRRLLDAMSESRRCGPAAVWRD